MKDYRLSEIKNHDWNVDWQVSEDDAKGYREENFLRSVKHELKLLDIDPRDMVELPCKEHFTYTHDNGHITENWRVYYRSEFDLIETAIFPTESEADAFLAKLKGENENDTSFKPVR